MADPPPSSEKFTTQNSSGQPPVTSSSGTIGLVSASDFRKRRAEVLDAQDRESRDVSLSGTSTPSRSLTGTPVAEASDATTSTGPVKKKAKKKAGKKLLSFGDDDDDDEGGDGGDDDTKIEKQKKKFAANTSVGVVPKAMTKAALRKEASEREALRQEYLALQEAVKAAEIAIPFVFFDGANTPGGIVRMKKGDFIWLFLDKSRRVGAELGTGDKSAARRAWARVGVDDLMLVRGSVIIPHHYDFLSFIMNKTLGPGGHKIFDYSTEAPPKSEASAETKAAPQSGIVTVADKAKAKAEALQALPDVNTLEGADADPNLTKVVDRRWYERNKHIYPASTWQEFDSEKDYTQEVRRDAGGNAFFFSR